MHTAVLRSSMYSIVLFGLLGCEELLMPDPAMPDASDGAAFFSENCTSCHGTSAKGDGPMAARLTKAPPDLTQLSRKNGGTFPEAEALSYIYGDPERGHLARVMPEFGDAMSQDLVPVDINGILTPTPRALAGLLFYLESIQQP